MVIKAVKFRKDGFYSQPFVFGGEEGPDKFDPNIRYRGSLQNYLIDTGNEVILVDTGIPAGTPEEAPDESSVLYTGKDICTYMEALANLGYKPEQVTKILLTHKHNDHSGELKSFPNAEIFVNEEDCEIHRRCILQLPRKPEDQPLLLSGELRQKHLPRHKEPQSNRGNTRR